jgi:peptidyl-prolyl cis-trans isomerase B (cyclophilin B)
LVCGLIVLSGCGGDNKAKTAASKTTSGSTAGGGSGRCEQVSEPRPRTPKRSRPPRFRLSRGKTYLARVVTSCGNFDIELDSKQAPRTGGSFVTLARKGFYDNTTFHRIVTGFVIQGGDPTGTGSGGPGYSVREPPPSDIVYSEGVVAMAKAGTEPAGTSGSQFFVVTSDSTLPPDYALLGHVTKGLDVVHRIEEVPAGPDERPTQPIVIKRIDTRVK